MRGAGHVTRAGKETRLFTCSWAPRAAEQTPLGIARHVRAVAKVAWKGLRARCATRCQAVWKGLVRGAGWSFRGCCGQVF